MTDSKPTLTDWLDQYAPIKTEPPTDEAIAIAKHFGVEGFVSEWNGNVAVIGGVRVQFHDYSYRDGDGTFPSALVERSDPDAYESWTPDIITFAMTLREEIKWVNRPMVIHHAISGDWDKNPLNEGVVSLNQHLRGGWKIAHIETSPDSSYRWYTLTRN